MLKNDISSYLEQAIFARPHFEKWKGVTSLPIFFSGFYEIFEAEILHQKTLFVLIKGSGNDIDSITPSAIQKHLRIIKEKWAGPVAFAAESLSAYDRRRLMEYGVQFIVPGTTMYLPEFGMAIKERLQERQKRNKHLSPSAQLLLLHAIIKKDYRPQTPSKFAQQSGYAAMTYSRALDELENLELAAVKNKGRERILEFPIIGKELWVKALPFLRTPVKKILWFMNTPELTKYPKAGFTALADCSMLAEPNNDEYAIGEKIWKAIEKNKSYKKLPYAEKGAVAVEVWKYNPELLGATDWVDPLSLYLSLMHNKEARVGAALDTMLEDYFGKGH